MTNPLVRLQAMGQSLWYDFITRDLLDSGKLDRLIEEDDLRGMTSNPTIFQQALEQHQDYDEDIRTMASEGHSAAEIFEALAVADVQAACDAFHDCYHSTGRRDGLVSLEVSPELAHEPDATLSEARRLWQAVDRPNLMIKIPGTAAGLPAVRHALAEGINVNITLLFSVDRYREVIDAFMGGLEDRLRSGKSIDGIASVASFFISRVDSAVDPQLDEAGHPELRSKAAIANAAMAYQAFEQSLESERWRLLAREGARVQRPLWASTSTKDAALSDVLYVESLIARDTVNTLPPVTYDAYRDHGQPELRIGQAIEEAGTVLSQLAEAGIDLEAVTARLEEEGVTKFAASYASLLKTIETKAGQLAST